jgi:AraC family transcriptional regulator of arabinose operon
MKTEASIFHISIIAAHIWQLWPSWKTEIPPNRYDFFNLWFVWKGQGRLLSGGEPADLRPGTCALLRPGGDYQASHDPAHPIGYTRIAFYFLDAAGKPFQPPEEDLPPGTQFVSDWHLADSALRKVVAAFAEDSEPGRTLAEAYLQAFLLHVRHSASHPAKGVDMERLRPALQAIQEQPHRQFRVGALAKLVQLSGNQFTRLFKAATNATPSQYIIQQRLNRARELLDTTMLSVSEIADILGYPDVFAFSRQFRRKTGVSPRQWRATGSR